MHQGMPCQWENKNFAGHLENFFLSHKKSVKKQLQTPVGYSIIRCQYALLLTVCVFSKTWQEEDETYGGKTWQSFP